MTVLKGPIIQRIYQDGVQAAEDTNNRNSCFVNWTAHAGSYGCFSCWYSHKVGYSMGWCHGYGPFSIYCLTLDSIGPRKQGMWYDSDNSRSERDSHEWSNVCGCLCRAINQCFATYAAFRSSLCQGKPSGLSLQGKLLNNYQSHLPAG